MNFLKHADNPLRIVGIGEAMIEFAPAQNGMFKRGFAGDTLNTCWYLRHILSAQHEVVYGTRVGSDSISNDFVTFLAAAGISTEAVSRDRERTLGLYMITLEGAERRFSYWRETSAARRLADDSENLSEILKNTALVYLSGISLAVIGARGRDNLHIGLAEAKRSGTRVAFDSNIRLRLWPDEAAARDAIEKFLELADIALPSFDDEAGLWKDVSPEITVERLAGLGAREIVVKNGAGSAVVYADDVVNTVSAKLVPDAIDTTAAGDSFNAAYLAARCIGYDPIAACKMGHALAGEVVRHRGALAPREVIEPFRLALLEQK